MSENFDDITDGSISIDRAKHHCGRLAVDCGWRAMEVEMHIDAQARIIAVLRDEVKAWRDWRKLVVRYMTCEQPDPTVKIDALKKACSATDAAGALEDK